MAAAEYAANRFEAVTRALDQWNYMPHTASMQVAEAKRDVRAFVDRLRALLEALEEPWRPHESPLYHRIVTAEQSGSVNERVFAPFLKDLTTNPNYDFLRGDAEFQKLIEQYRPRAGQA